MSTNPYVGPRAFRVGENLPARAREQRELTDLVIAERIVLLHAPSGAGMLVTVSGANHQVNYHRVITHRISGRSRCTAAAAGDPGAPLLPGGRRDRSRGPGLVRGGHGALRPSGHDSWGVP